MVHLDELDRKILKLLQLDGRATHSEIARQLEVGHTRVRDHVLRMEEAGVIRGYRATINPIVLGFSIHCLVHVQVDQEEDFSDFMHQLLEMNEVVEVTNLTGEYDVIVRAWLKDTIHLRDFLYNKLSVLPAHNRTVSSIILDRKGKPLGIGG